MVSRHPNIWKWLPLIGLGLLLLGAFAPLPDPLERVFLGMGSAIYGVYFWAVTREDRRKRQADQSSSAISSGDQT